MQQWDSLHAMLIYESLGLRESIRDVSESRSWNHEPKVQGLGSPFLLKVRTALLPPLTPLFPRSSTLLDCFYKGY
jgi:hypothetical protein